MKINKKNLMKYVGITGCASGIQFGWSYLMTLAATLAKGKGVKAALFASDIAGLVAVIYWMNKTMEYEGAYEIFEEDTTEEE